MNLNLSLIPHVDGAASFEAETLAYWVINPAATFAEILAINANIRAIKYSSGITLSSVTARFSYPAGGLFFFEPTSIDLRYLAGMDAIITVSDGSKTFTFYPGSLGTGETLAASLALNGDMEAGSPQLVGMLKQTLH